MFQEVSGLAPSEVVQAVVRELGQRAIIEEERETLSLNLSAYVRKAWAAVEPGTPYVHGFHIDAICLHLQALARREIRNLIITLPPRHSKALDKETPILTTWGWKPHGDLSPGDFVFGPDGKPKRVLACTEEMLEESYEVEFDDGAKIIAGKEHLWSIERDTQDNRKKFMRSRVQMIVRTDELIRSGFKRPKAEQRPDRIPLSLPVEAPIKRFLIDPYLLGAWLGDGATDSGCLYAAEMDIQHFSRLGSIGTIYPPSGARTQNFYRIKIPELQTRLRVMGLLGNKHIPAEYLAASIDQRWELLRGLMDTDGHCDKSGRCHFINVLEHLSLQIHELISSLGIKAFYSSRFTMLNGKRFGPHYQISFTPPAGARIFNLERKQKRIVGHINPRSRFRYVAAVRAMGCRKVKCIQVEGNVYLAGKAFVATHNSLLCSVFFPTWTWTHDPAFSFLCMSYGAHLSIRDALKSRRLIQSNWYQDRWADVFRLTGDQNAKSRYENNLMGYRVSSSVGGLGTGEGASCLLVDDPINLDEVHSDVIREGVNEWWDQVMSTRLNDPKKGVRLIIMQRGHETDLAGHLLSKGGWEHLNLPAEFEMDRRKTSIGWSDPRKKRGELICPERFGQKEIDELKATLGPYGSSSQLQQRPSPAEGGIFKKSWFQLWPYDVKLPIFDYVIQSYDTAFTEATTNDESACTVWGLFQHPKLKKTCVFLVDCWHDHLGYPDLRKKVREDLRAKYGESGEEKGVDLVLVEEKGSGITLLQDLRMLGVPAYGYNPTKADKIVRAHASAPFFFAGLVYLLESGKNKGNPVSWTDTFIHQMLIFPNGTRDDFVDSATQTFIFLRNKEMITAKVGAFEEDEPQPETEPAENPYAA